MRWILNVEAKTRLQTARQSGLIQTQPNVRECVCVCGGGGGGGWWGGGGVGGGGVGGGGGGGGGWGATLLCA